jgi:hypothetical protein
MSLETATKTDTCQKCAYWNAQSVDNGECRRHSPQSISFKLDSETKFETRFPNTVGSDWCGEFKSN